MENNTANAPTHEAVSRDELETLNQDLTHLNSQLLQYAHVASHDLQEPLRKIHIFAGILANSETLSGKDRQIVSKILESSARMSGLIKGLREHARVIESRNMSRPVDLSIVVAKVVEDFELTIAEKDAVIHIDPLPIVDAVALEMNQLFYHLVDNALKFAAPSRIPEIAIRCKKLSAAAAAEYLPNPKKGKTYYDISVRDNGIGFDVRYSEQIFEIFKRLHPKEMYSGAGIGLSLCRAIADKHGGTLFVESKPGEGSAFHIIIPEQHV